MKVYISGAITNNEYYKQQFAEAEEKLTAEGHSVINPAKNQGYTYKEYIDTGLFELMHCDAIYMLTDWVSSTGARLEYEYAKAVGLEIISKTPDQLETDEIRVEFLTEALTRLQDVLTDAKTAGEREIILRMANIAITDTEPVEVQK